MHAEDLQASGSSEESSKSESSSVKRSSKDKYTSTRVIQPAGQRLNEIDVLEENLADIQCKIDEYRASREGGKFKPTLFDPKGILKAHKGLLLP